MRTGNDELMVVLRDIFKGLTNLGWCRCRNCREVEAQIRYRRRRTRKCSSEISGLYQWCYRFVAEGIIVVTYMIYRLIACTAKPYTCRSVTVRRIALASRSSLTVQCPWLAE